MTVLLADRAVHLRPVRREDLSLLTEWRNDPDIRRVTRDWRALTKTDQHRWFERVNAPDRRDHMFVVERATDSLPLGLVGLVGWSPADGTAEITFFIGPPEARRQGYGRAAVRLLLTWGFDVMRLERIVAETYEFNDASFALLTSLGFVVEGRMRSHVQRDGRRWDANILGLMRDEWRRAPIELSHV